MKDDQTLPLGETKQMPTPKGVPFQVAITSQPEPSVAMMLEQVIKGGVTADSVGTLERMIALYERMEDKKAEKAFTKAFAELQKELPKIQATKPVPDKHGNIKYHYAPYQEILEIAQPFLTKHGFAVSFDSAYLGEGRINEIMKLSHRDGHSEKTSFAVRIGAGPHGSNEPQADMAARLVAMRGCLCNTLNIAIAHDDDGRALGGPITAEKAEELRRRVRNLEVHEKAFLTFCGATEFEDITTERLEDGEDYLNKVAAKKRAQ